MSKRDTWLAIYVGDYLGDTMALTTQQHGAYLLLLMHYWRGGPLPNDDSALASITKVSGKEWVATVGPVIRRFFTIGDDGLLHQKRMDSEIAKTKRTSDARSAAAGTRWNGGGGSSAPPNETAEPCKPDANAYAKRDASQSQTNLQNECIPDANGGVSRADMRSHHLNLHQESKKASDLTVGASDAARDVRQILWSDGLVAYRRLTGRLDGPSRRRLGQLLREACDDCGAVLGALQECPITPDADAWLTAAVQARASPKPAGKLGFLRKYDGPIPGDPDGMWPLSERFQ